MTSDLSQKDDVTIVQSDEVTTVEIGVQTFHYGVAKTFGTCVEVASLEAPKETPSIYQMAKTSRVSLRELSHRARDGL